MTGFMQGKRLSEEKTRAHLGGPFFKGWWFSISHIDRWADGFPGHEDDVMDEYFNHTVMGSMAGFIQIQNDPRGYDAVFGKSSKYWKSRFKAFWWSAAFSTQWKLGPISEATIGHTKQGYIDYVITPTVGMALLTTEDMLERWVVIPFEKKYSNHAWQAVVRWVCAPTRAAASALSFRTPWHRHGRKLGELIEGNVTGWKP